MKFKMKHFVLIGVALATLVGGGLAAETKKHSFRGVVEDEGGYFPQWLRKLVESHHEKEKEKVRGFAEEHGGKNDFPQRMAAAAAAEMERKHEWARKLAQEVEEEQAVDSSTNKIPEVDKGVGRNLVDNEQHHLRGVDGGGVEVLVDTIRRKLAGQLLSSPCMADNYNEYGQGGGLQCTAEDVKIANVTNINVTDPCGFPGDTVDFTATVAIECTAKERHDIGLYFAEDGGDAKTGICTIATLPLDVDLDGIGDDTTNSNDFGYCDFVNGPTPPDNPPPDDPNTGLPQPCNEDADCTFGTAALSCQEFGPGVQDTCGDIKKGLQTLEISFTGVLCQDTDDPPDGLLDIFYCTSWRQSGANELCLSPLAAYPGAPSKCKCGKVPDIDIPVPPGQLSVVKTADPTSVDEPGGNVTFTVNVTNTSPFAVFNLTSLVDSIYGDLTAVPGSTCEVPQTIAVGASYSCMFTVFVEGNAGDTETDTVTASGVDENNNTVSGEDNATVTIDDVPSSITVEKTANPTSVPEPGDDVDFTVVVTNNSTVDNVTIDSLTDSVYENLNGKGNCSVPQVLLPGESYTCVFTEFVDGNADFVETDVVTASGIDDDGDPVTASDNATVTVTDVAPAARVTKAVRQVVASYEVVVINDSDAEDLTLDALVDDQFGDITNVQGNVLSTTCNKTTIAIGENYTCTFDGKITESPHVNNVTATVSDNDDGSINSTSNAVRVEFGNVGGFLA